MSAKLKRLSLLAYNLATVLFAAIHLSGCSGGESQQTTREATPDAAQEEQHAIAPPTLDVASPKTRTGVLFVREEGISYTMQNGKTVGQIPGVVGEKDTGKVIASYDLRIEETLPGGYLLCRGTYWIPYPVPKPDISWESVPATIAYYSVPEHPVGVLLDASGSIGEEDMKKYGHHIGQMDQTQIILTSDFTPALFGKGSLHLLRKNRDAQQDESTVPSKAAPSASSDVR